MDFLKYLYIHTEIFVVVYFLFLFMTEYSPGKMQPEDLPKHVAKGNETNLASMAEDEVHRREASFQNYCFIHEQSSSVH